MLKLISITLISLGIAATSHAGFVKENGGNTVVCFNGFFNNYELLDLFEAEHNSDKLHFTGMVKASKTELLAKTAGILTEVTGDNIFNTWLKDFDSNIDFVADDNLSVVPDTAYQVWDPTCTVHQTVIQWGTGYYKSRYKINLDLWKQLSPQHQAALMIHEIVFGYFILKASLFTSAYPISESTPVRQITAFLFSDEIGKMTLDQQKEEFLKLNLISKIPIVLEKPPRR